ncbi:hypothetical protein ACFSR9_07870 [Deinococcus taklimakanensis]|uniref:Uncharacterized protein n=1 Tax=Deinococcus taklimakanensis TaxID=536443 RepID=A0ABW5P4E5_9DEIO
MTKAILFDLHLQDGLDKIHSKQFAEILIKTARLIVRSNISSISVWKNFMSESCSDKTIACVLHEDFPPELRDERRVIISRLGRDPYIEDIIEDFQVEQNIIISAYIEGILSSSFAAAYILRSPLYDILPSNLYKCADCKVRLEQLENDEDSVVEFSFEASILDPNQDEVTTSEILLKYTRMELNSPQQIVEYLDNLSSVRLYPGARDQILELNGRRECNSVLRHLVEIAFWSQRLPEVDFSHLPVNASDESRSTLQNPQLMAHRHFNDGRGNGVKFSFHTKPAGGLRIYLKLEAVDCVSIGYVGPHLPL